MKRFPPATSILLAIAFASLCALPCIADEPVNRYFYGGDGVIDIASFKGAYRDASGTYVPSALAKIRKAYGGPMEIRFLEFLDYLQDHFKGGKIRITSGYRSPTYNASLRTKGKLAGKASMHQYGMAADIRMKGVHPEKIWLYVRDLNYGGVGYYHGANAHVDVGPARFWDETSSKVGTTHADDNKLITLIPHRDIYLPGEEIVLRFVRMTAYPIGVDRRWELERRKEAEWKSVTAFAPTFSKNSDETCPEFSRIDEMKDIRWTLPKKLKPGRYRIRAPFCDKEWDAMPESIASYEFEVR